MDQKQTLYVPIKIGPNRMRGSSIGMLVDEDDGASHLHGLRAFVRAHAATPGLGRAATDDEVTGAIQTMLDMSMRQHADRPKRSTEGERIVGNISEFDMPDGSRVVMAEQRFLAQAKRTRQEQDTQAPGDADDAIEAQAPAAVARPRPGRGG